MAWKSRAALARLLETPDGSSSSYRQKLTPPQRCRKIRQNRDSAMEFAVNRHRRGG